MTRPRRSVRNILQFGLARLHELRSLRRKRDGKRMPPSGKVAGQLLAGTLENLRLPEIPINRWWRVRKLEIRDGSVLLGYPDVADWSLVVEHVPHSTGEYPRSCLIWFCLKITGVQFPPVNSIPKDTQANNQEIYLN